MPSILFVCTANLCRSPLAAALFYKKLQVEGQSHLWIVESAGTWTVPGQHVPRDVFRAARAMDVDLRNHSTRQLDADLLAKYDFIIVMERGHRESLNFEFPAMRKKIHLLSEFADRLEYDVADPAVCDVPTGEIAAEILKLIHRAYPKICQLAQAHEVMDMSSDRYDTHAV